ncbi:acyl-CoA dehydrogenase domain protein [Parafrankia sp. EAN1pec]|uniref:acyl-CoA dehydrogenase family protein n=1 Tax=Parafrankia sp. (strain EAN1pec) TaxID=298653 RepID=UPI0000540826|nr:acyl-CoA dehydrogenase domain protein [Frankia sp. EAN1pec]
MDFWESDELAAHRDAARAWAEANVEPEWAEQQHTTGCHQTVEMHVRLARDGILGAGWPAEYGGSDVDPDFARAVFDECALRGLHTDGWSTTVMVARTLEQVGTEAQKRRYLPAALRGELMVALGYSEPDTGSDVAAAKTAAFRDGDSWLINGQKMFTSTAQVCSHVFVLARTNFNAPKHKGLSLFLVPTDSTGLAIQPIHTLGGQVTNATFYTDVRVPDTALVGAVDEGWDVMKVALVYERGVGAPASLTQTLSRDLAAWARQAGRPDGMVAFDDPLTAERIGRIAVDELVTRAFTKKVNWLVHKGDLPGIEGNMRKLFSSEATQRHYSETLDILGADGILAPGAANAPAGGIFEHAFRAAVVTTIYGGASEILREIIAERHLILPRNRPH